MVASSTAPDIDQLVINVGSGIETSTRSLANLVISITGSKAYVVPNAQDSGGISRLCADLTLAQHKLNFSPSVSLNEGLQLLLQRDARYKNDKVTD